MSDTIRKAVELADGWHHYRGSLASVPEWYSIPGDASWLPWSQLSENSPLARVHRDALAAQLVRQVDALMLHVDVYAKRSEVLDGPDIISSSPFSEDPTMNTITAIIESGVLK